MRTEVVGDWSLAIRNRWPALEEEKGVNDSMSDARMLLFARAVVPCFTSVNRSGVERMDLMYAQRMHLR
jgi:hypothetical protein